MKLINNYKENHKKYIDSYSFEERNNSVFLAFLTNFIILIPLVLIVVELYFVFIMVPYLMATLALIVAFLLDYTYCLFRKLSLLKMKRIEGLKYYQAILFEFIIPDLIFLLIYFIGIFVLIPKFVF